MHAFWKIILGGAPMNEEGVIYKMPTNQLLPMLMKQLDRSHQVF